MGEWRRYSVSDIAASSPSALATGPFGSSISSQFFTLSGIPVIRGGNLSANVGTRLDETDLVFVSREKAREFGRSIVRVGDLIFTCWGTVNQVGIVSPGLRHQEFVISNKQMKLTPDPTKADSLFLYYLFSSPALQEQLSRNSIGSSVPGFNLGQLRAMQLVLPESSEQRAIARILGALDDKIELNRRMSATLEEMARALFRSWFVDFDPVRAKAEGRDPGLPADIEALFPDRFEESELGEIPAGWEVGNLGKVATSRRQTVDPSEIASETPYIALENMPRRSISLSDWSTSAVIASQKFEFRQDDILFGKLRPYFHKVGVAPIAGVCSTDIVVVVPASPDWFGWVLGIAASDDFVSHLSAGSTGTRMPRTSWSEMSAYRVALPPVSLAKSASKVIGGIVDRLRRNIEQSRTLAALRDSLLPKLISGELRVPEELLELASEAPAG